MKYIQKKIKEDTYIVVEDFEKYKKPVKAYTFAFDTENIVLVDGRKLSQEDIYKTLHGLALNEKREKIKSDVWAWQCYDELNGFFMTNDFYLWLDYISRVGYKFGWCYNAKFDFSQIDYKILVENEKGWKQNEGKGKGQAYTFNSIHNDMGARYSYKLWIPYKNQSRHKYTHSVDLRDFMNIFAGGLKRTLESLDVRDNENKPIRKLEMEYQAIDFMNLTEEEINYCCNDVKGLYFAIKQYDQMVKIQTDGERSIFGKGTNIMTAGGLAKAELLRSIFPKYAPKDRIGQFKKNHPIDANLDEYARKNGLYRGGICFVNPKYKGKLLKSSDFNSPMYRYDVNSEYPYAMTLTPDLVGAPIYMKYEDWIERPNSFKQKYECIYCLEEVEGVVKRGYWGLWYDPFQKEYTDTPKEKGLHLIFEREFNELLKWYDLTFLIEDVILFKRGKFIFKKFIEENYELKREAKKQKNKGLEAVAKLKLNSSYGKLSEKIKRNLGHYEENKETGAVHFVLDGEEINDKNSMSIYIGALITSIARCYIMGKLREIHGEKMTKYAIYIDTDSIHTFKKYDKANPYELGALKLEAECDIVKYLLPKTYIDCVKENGEILAKNCEVHTKGINLNVVKKELEDNELSESYINKHFHYGKKFVCLCALNCKGGKVLIPVDKYLARPEEDPLIKFSGYDGSIMSEI